MRKTLSITIALSHSVYSIRMQASEFNALLAPGNSIRLTSSDEPQLNVTIELDWMGETIIPLCGKQIMRGMTLKEAHSSISQCLKKYFKNTQNFGLNIVVPPQFSVKVGWRNESTSIVKVPADTSINSILARTGHAPSRETIIRLLSPYGLDIVLPAAASEWTKPFSWRGGESLILEVPVPEKTHYFVDVLGEVKKPGKISYKPAQSILSIIKQAHGLTTTADQDSVVIVRTTTGKKISTRWDDQNTKIEPGDVVYVPAQRESGFEKGLRWTGSILAVINTFFIVMLARKG